MAGFLDLKRLRYFEAIAEHRSLSAAARALNLAQPALSHHVTQLETALGMRLLERRHDGVELTEAGRMLQLHAADIGARVSLAEAELRRLSRERRGEVRIRLAVIGSLAAGLTPILLAALARQMPEVVPRITEAGTLDSRDLLERGEADFAVHLTANDERDTLLATEQLFFITAGADDADAAPIALADVVREQLILPAAGNPLRSFIERAVSRAGFQLEVALEIDGVEPRRRAVLARLGSTILGGYSVAAGDARTELAARPIVAPELFRPIYLGSRRGLDASLVARVSSVLTQSLKDYDVAVARRIVAATRD